MYVSTHARFDGERDGWVGGWIVMDGWMGRQTMDEQTDGWMGPWVGGCMYGWIDINHQYAKKH